MITGASRGGTLRPMAYTPMTREEAEAVLAHDQLLGGFASVEQGAREYEARLVVEGKSADEIYERLTDFLGERPNATEDERTQPG